MPIQLIIILGCALLVYANGLRIHTPARKIKGGWGILTSLELSALYSSPRGKILERTNESIPSSIFSCDVAKFGISTALAEEHIDMGNFEQAKALAMKAIDAAGNTHEINNIYSAYAEGILADALFEMGDYKDSAIHYKMALKVYEHHSQSSTGPEALELAGALQLIAWSFLAQKSYEEAKHACVEALRMTEKLLGPRAKDVGASLVNLATTYSHTNEPRKRTEALYNRALSIYEECRSDEQGDDNAKDALAESLESIGAIHACLGNLYFLERDYDNAAAHFSKVTRLHDERKISASIAAAPLKNLGLILWKQNRMQEAELMLARALFLIETAPEYGANHPQAYFIRDDLSRLRSGEKCDL